MLLGIRVCNSPPLPGIDPELCYTNPRASYEIDPITGVHASMTAPTVINSPVIGTPPITGVLPDDFREYLASIGQTPPNVVSNYVPPGAGLFDNFELPEQVGDTVDWFTDSTLIEPIPNWAVAVGGGIAAYFLARNGGK